MIIVEIQSTNGQSAVVATVHSERSEAEQKYHQVLSYAAVSNVEVHSVVMLDDYGTRIKGESYQHCVSEVE